MQQDKLNELYQLRMKGLIDEEEFRRMEQELMAAQRTVSQQGHRLNNSRKTPDETNPFVFYVKCWKNYINFMGRATRMEYWSFTLINGIISTLLNIGMFNSNNILNESNPFSIISSLFWIITFLPSLAVLVRRLHDTGRSGKAVLFMFLSGLGSILTFWLIPIALILLIIFLVLGIYLFVITLLPSMEGENIYDLPEPPESTR